MAEPLIPKLALPLTMGANGFETVEQGSGDEIAQCVYVIVATPLGSRIDDVEFGVEDPTFDQLPLDTREMLQQVQRYEPDAEVSVAQEIEELAARVVVEVVE